MTFHQSIFSPSLYMVQGFIVAAGSIREQG